MANNYNPERPIDDLSLSANEFCHADVLQAIMDDNIRVYRSRLPVIVNHACIDNEWKDVASSATWVEVARFQRTIAPWASAIYVLATLYDNANVAARFRFRYVAGDDGVSKSVVMPDADGDWDGGGHYSGQKTLPLQGLKGNWYDEIDVEIRVYCMEDCEAIVCSAYQAHT